jgi:NADPH-dependent 2,4-dienoyl-CoA reductase/sulfur reductase-like enzyme
VRLKEAIRVAAARAAAERRPAHGVVLGASFAGVKVAEVLRAAQMNVTVVEQEACILPLAARPECACVLQEHLLEKGYALQLGTSLQRVEPADGRLVARLAGDAAPVEADVIVVCTGSRPTLDFLAEGEVAADAGLIVDEHLRTNVEGLYAAGDVAQALNPATGKHEVVALWANARRQGRVAGLNMAGAHAEYPGNLPYNITRVGDLVFASGGTMRTFDALEVEGQSGEITACAFANGRLTGFNLVGDAVAPGPLVHALARGGQIDRGRSASSSGREARVSSADASLSGSRLASEWARRMTWTSMSAS